MGGLITLYDAARCPYCARARIVLAEKGIPYETVEIDLSDRPAWLFEKNPVGKVPVLEEDGWVLPESAVIAEYLNERYPSRRSGRTIPASAPRDGCSSSASTTSRSRTTRSGAARRERGSGSRRSSGFLDVLLQGTSLA